jgi:hypothetical protein
MLRSHASQKALFLGPGLVALAAVLSPALHGCLAVTCFTDEQQCGGESGGTSAAGPTAGGAAGDAPAGGGGAGGSGGTGGSTSTPCGPETDCWGAQCNGTECDIVKLDLPANTVAQRIAANSKYLYVPVYSEGSLAILQYTLSGPGPVGEFAKRQVQDLTMSITTGDGFTAASDLNEQHAYFSPGNYKGIIDCDFALSGSVVLPDPAPANILFNGIVVADAEHVYAVPKNIQSVYAIDLKNQGTDELSLGPPAGSMGGFNHALSAGTEGRLAWSLYNEMGVSCVAVGKVNDPACMPQCVPGSFQTSITGVAVDRTNNDIYFLTEWSQFEPQPPDQGGLWRAKAKTGDSCGYEDAVRIVTLNWLTSSGYRSIAVDDKYVYVAANAAADGVTEAVYRCDKTLSGGEIAQACTVVAKLKGDILGITTNGAGVLFASTAQVGWKHN